jgi:transposase
MSYEIRADYSERLLFPAALEEWVPADHPARFLRAFVDALDLPALGFAVRTAPDGRPSYASDLLLKVWLYGYLNKVRELRPLERACREHLSLVWLTGRHAPDHNTLWRFWRDHRGPLRGVFKQVVQLAAAAGLVEVVLHAVDGTKLAAAASKETLKSRATLERLLSELDEAVDTVMAEMEAAGSAATESEAGYVLPPHWADPLRQREQVRELLAQLEQTGHSAVAAAEREAALVKTRREGVVPGYNAQAVADSGGAGLLVAAELCVEPGDSQQLVPMLAAVEATLGTVAATTVADGGYYHPAQLAQAQARGATVVVNAGAQRAPAPDAPDTAYHAARFAYDAARDVCVCPRGIALPRVGARAAEADRGACTVYRCQVYQDCPVRRQCHPGKGGRRIEVSVHAAVRTQLRMQWEPSTRGLLRRRGGIIEGVFGVIKQALGFRRFTMRGREGAATQWALICTAFNLRKLAARWPAAALPIAPAV